MGVGRLRFTFAREKLFAVILRTSHATPPAKPSLKVIVMKLFATQVLFGSTGFASKLALLVAATFTNQAPLLLGQEARVKSETPSTEEAEYSGPQAGEAVGGFEVLGVFPPLENQKFDFVAKAKEKPLLLIFVHDLNRQSIAFTRILATYAASRQSDGLQTGIVWLDDDSTNAIATLRRIQHALPKDVSIGISVDGREGPGSYGLNRKVTLTILLIEKNKTIANHALIQPSLQVDMPKVLQSIVSKIGGEAPELASLEGMPPMESESSRNAGDPPNLRPWLTPIIRRDASEESVIEAASKFEAFLQDNQAAQKEIGRITQTIINAGKLENYGTPKAQEYLKRWFAKYGHLYRGEQPDQKKSDRPASPEKQKESPKR